jgi:hypothetical protein
LLNKFYIWLFSALREVFAMAFTLLTQMEASRLQKESILVRLSKNWSMISAGIFLLILAVLTIGLIVISDSTPAEGVSSSASSSTTDPIFMCAACFGIPAVLLLLAGAVLNLSTNRRIERYEQEYQKLHFQVIEQLEEK